MSKIRIIVQSSDASMAAHVGGPVETTYKSFDVHAPDLVTFMRSVPGKYAGRSIVGVEVLEDET